MEECHEIVKSHPGLVLVSENPITWKGFLIVDANFGFTVDIKLIVPNYPQLTDASLLFGRSISLLHGTGFAEKVYRLLESANTVSSLLLQLKRIVNNLVKEKFENCCGDATNFQGDIIDEIKMALRIDSPVKISASSGLSSVKLSYANVSAVVRRDAASNTWKVVSSDLPELSWLEPFNVNLVNLSGAITKFQNNVEMLFDTWSQLEEIDKTCWVVDPLKPKPYHLYRRINLTTTLSALITVDPMNIGELPDIKLLGSNKEVSKYRNIMCSNLLKWDPESSITDNLRILMAIDNLPQPPETVDEERGIAIFENDECCICFEMESDDNTPSEICNNEKCAKHFHTSCLRQWLQSIASNQVSFDRIHGNCPNCGEAISCSLTSS